MQIDLLEVGIFFVTLIVTVAVTFYIKDFFQKKSEYSKLRKKLERIAGKHATIIYNVPGSSGPGSSQLFKITDIDEHGITINNELQTIFIPVAKLIKSEMILPCDDYDNVKAAKLKKDMEQMMEAMMPALMNSIRKNFLEEMMMEKGEMSAVIGFKIQQVLSEEGFKITKVATEEKPK